MSTLLVISNYSDKEYRIPTYTFVSNLVAYQKPQFDNIYIIAPEPYFPKHLKPLGKYFDKIPRVLQKQDYTDGNAKIFFARYAPWAGQLSETNRTKTIWKAILRVVKKNKLEFDLIHGHMLCNAWFGLALKKIYNVPLVTTIHDASNHLEDNLKSDMVIQALQNSDVRIRVTPTDIGEINDVIGNKSKIICIPNGFNHKIVPLNPNREQLRTQISLPSNRFIFIGIAHWDQRKDPLILLEGIYRLKTAKDTPTPYLCLVGKDQSNGAIQRKIMELQLQNDIQLVGEQTPENVLRYILAGNAVVLYSHAEGNPTVMFEALGCGRPYIGSDVGGVRTVINDDRFGFYGPAKDPAALTALMKRAVNTDWNESVILDYSKQFTWEEIARRTYTEAYQPILKTLPPLA